MPVIIPNNNGDRTTPSCVAFTRKDQLVGKTAVFLAGENPENTIFCKLFKMIMGKKKLNLKRHFCILSC